MQSNRKTKQRRPSAAEMNYQKAMKTFLAGVSRVEGISLASLGEKYREALEMAGVRVIKSPSGCTELDIRRPKGIKEKELAELAKALGGCRRKPRKEEQPIKRKIQHFEPVDDGPCDPRELGFD